MCSLCDKHGCAERGCALAHKAHAHGVGVAHALDGDAELGERSLRHELKVAAVARDIEGRRSDSTARAVLHEGARVWCGIEGARSTEHVGRLAPHAREREALVHEHVDRTPLVPEDERHRLKVAQHKSEWLFTRFPSRKELLKCRC